MCDYSLQHVRSRPAQVGEKLFTHNFGTGTRGFCAAGDASTAICLLPGTELSFSKDVRHTFCSQAVVIAHRTAIFRQVNKEIERTHHDALEFPDGQIVLLTHMVDGQEATVLQLPALPKTEAEAQAQKRVAYAG